VDTSAPDAICLYLTFNRHFVIIIRNCMKATQLCGDDMRYGPVIKCHSSS
jgi:hypothetical protein